MKPIELGSKIADLVWGKRIEGTIAAVLPSQVFNSSRYVVTTPQKEFLDIHVPAIENHGIIFQSYTYHPPLSRNSQISRRATNIRPWVDGQTL